MSAAAEGGAWLAGGCHCGAVRWRVDPGAAPELIDCDCSICAMTGYLHLIVPAGRFAFERGEDRLTAYRFGTGAAAHLFCATCGIKSVYRPRSHPDGWSVNARCLDGGAPAHWPVIPFAGRADWDAARAGLE